MTAGFSINKLPTSTTDNNVDVAVITQSDLALNRNLSKVTGLYGGTAVYDLQSGDLSLPAQVVSRISYDQGTKVLQPTFQWTLAFNTWQLYEDADGLITSVAPVEFGIWAKSPFRQRLAAADIIRGVGAAYALCGSGIASGVINPDRVAKKVIGLDAYVF